ncbi:MAG: protocatechuate 3,4-dioxygenase subunit alpha, partial [Pseudomonadota bacterium]|nr:protocatechuate 3,4-dioxygenase subunit alpha [Pseudomonadota bacterium]
MNAIVTPSQTVGPFFHIGLERSAVSNLAAGVVAEPIEIMGRVLDGDGQPVIDALIEIWQANA